MYRNFIRKRKTALLFCLSLTLLLGACKNKDTERQLSYRFASNGVTVIGCEPKQSWAKTYAVLFRTETEFHQWDDCFSRFDPIDFSKESLVFILFAGDGCGLQTEFREVLADETSNRVTLVIEAIHEGSCARALANTYWVVAEAIPPDVEVMLEIHHTRTPGP